MTTFSNPTAWGWQSYTGFFWAGMTLLCILWSYFRLPETKGMTYAELDLMFERKLSARKFNTAEARDRAEADFRDAQQ